MKVILFGASGMIGQAVLRECLIDAQVEKVLSITRSAGEMPPGLLSRSSA
jgi:nucleoside-diphosphate-sugar epimerase